MDLPECLQFYTYKCIGKEIERHSAKYAQLLISASQKTGIRKEGKQRDGLSAFQYKTELNMKQETKPKIPQPGP